MLANFFEKTKPINIIVLSLVFFVYYFLHLYLLKNNGITQTSWTSIYLGLCINIIFLTMNTLNFKKNNVSNDNLHNTFILVLLYGLFPKAFMSVNVLLISLLFLLIYKSIAQFKPKLKNPRSLFNAGIFSGIAFILYDWSILFLVYILIGVLLSQKLNLKNIISPIFGFFTPIFLYFTYLFVLDKEIWFLHKLFTIPYYSFSTYPTNVKYAIFVTLTIVSISILSVLPQILSVSGQNRYQYAVAILTLITGFTVAMLKTHKNGSEFLLIFTPASIVIGRFIKTISHKKLKEILFLGITICSILFLVINSKQ